MTAGIFTLYDSFSQLVANGTMNLGSDVFKVMLVTSSYIPNQGHGQKTDITNELGTANGYTAGGATLGSRTWLQNAGVATFQSANVLWSASGTLTARYAVMYDDTSTNKRLVGWMMLDATPVDVTVTTGNTLTIAPDAVQGWFQLTVNP